VRSREESSAARRRPGPPPAILLYHRVALTTADEDPLRLAVSPEAFESQMGYLWRRGYATTPLEERLGAEAGSRRVAITFDDGYLDNYAAAFPILQRYGFVATIFIVPGFVGAARRWERTRPVPLMTWSHAREMARHGISFQSHTSTHPDLTGCDDERLWRELAGSRREIEERIGERVSALAYPFGAFDSRVLGFTERAGYRSAYAAGMARAGRFARERFQVTSRDGPATFALKASGWGGPLRRALQCLRPEP
jgi:peptidoglycan/xylan/chitin deacetylase (PgdA/CDA1 family)